MVTNAPVIAVVDDDPSVRRALRRLIQTAGYRVQTFASAEAFLDSWRARPPACLVLDIYLEGMSGLELQERLVRDGVDCSVVFVTAHDDARTTARIQRSGAAGCLGKPVDERALLAAIDRATAGRRAGAEAGE